MSNEEMRQFQFGCFMVIIMNGTMALLTKWLGLPVEWWLISLSLAFMFTVFGLCTVMIRGWMPKDKPDWDSFGADCQRQFKDK